MAAKAILSLIGHAEPELQTADLKAAVGDSPAT